MLRARLITAAVLLSLFLLALFGLPAGVLALLLAGVCILAAWEWSHLCHGHPGTIIASIAVIEVIAYQFDAVLIWVVSAGVAWWLWCLVRLRGDSTPGDRTGCAVRGILILVPAWGALVWLRQEFGPYGVLAAFLVVWLADAGAYFVGRRWGRRKLAPRVSPGKTVEGLIGGLGAVCVFALASTSFAAARLGVSEGVWLGLCLVAGLFSVVGDLVESKAKRAAGVKDSGSLLPGHGGVLDRIDSVAAAAPILAFGLYWLSGAS